jgi:hypothetical protein
MEEQKPFPITPSPELVEQWAHLPADWNTALIAQWGADQELAACCEYLLRCAQWEPEDVDELLAARRPKPPSLKEQALQALAEAVKMADDVPPEGICSDQADIIRRALEQLDD